MTFGPHTHAHHTAAIRRLHLADRRVHGTRGALPVAVGGRKSTALLRNSMCNLGATPTPPTTPTAATALAIALIARAATKATVSVYKAKPLVRRSRPQQEGRQVLPAAGDAHAPCGPPPTHRPKPHNPTNDDATHANSCPTA